MNHSNDDCCNKTMFNLGRNRKRYCLFFFSPNVLIHLYATDDQWIMHGMPDGLFLIFSSSQRNNAKCKLQMTLHCSGDVTVFTTKVMMCCFHLLTNFSFTLWLPCHQSYLMDNKRDITDKFILHIIMGLQGFPWREYRNEYLSAQNRQLPRKTVPPEELWVYTIWLKANF